MIPEELKDVININFNWGETLESLESKIKFKVKSENSKGIFLCRVYETDNFDLVLIFKDRKLDSFAYSSKDLNLYKNVLSKLELKYNMKDYTKKVKKISCEFGFEKSLFGKIDKNTDIIISKFTNEWSFSLNKHKKLFGLF